MTIASTRILLGTILCLSIFLESSALGALRTPTPREFADWQRSAATQSEALRKKIAAVQESYEIVFVPGILGSQLKIGNFVYGRDPISAKKLLYSVDQAIESSTLNEFRAQIAKVFKKNVDIYGDGLNLLQGANRGRSPIEFAYDWRDDLRRSAKALNEFLLKKLPRKKFVIVAHSMGGVIAWHWKNEHNFDHKQNLIAIVLLGSPLQGSCEPIRMLIQGYGPPQTSGNFEKWATHLVFGEARAAIPTFPSVFQLLPSFDLAHPCLKVRRGAIEQIFRHDEVDSWLGRDGGDYQLDPDFAKLVSLDMVAYKNRVQAAIIAGREFRLAFDARPYDDQVYILYSQKYPLASGYTALPNSSKWLKIDKEWPSVDSDGRVPRDSAINFGNLDARNSTTSGLDNEHGDLLKDPRFAQFVTDNIAPLIEQAQQREILEFATNDPKLRRQLEANGWFADAGMRSISLERVPELSRAAMQLAKYNHELLLKNANDPRFATIDFQKMTPEQAAISAGKIIEKLGDPQSAATLYSTAIALDPQAVDAATYRDLGRIKLKEGHTSEAADYFERAVVAAKIPDIRWNANFLGETHRYLGTTFERAGSPNQAILEYEAAKTYGNLWSSTRLKDIQATPNEWKMYRYEAGVNRRSLPPN